MTDRINNCALPVEFVEKHGCPVDKKDQLCKKCPYLMKRV